MEQSDSFKEKNDTPQPAPSFRERRFLPRWKIHCAALIRWEGLEKYLDCEINNLNLKGFAVSLSHKLPMDCCKITLRMSKEFIFDVEISVLWRRLTEEKNTYGVKFTKIRDADKEKIYQLVRRDFPELLADHS